MKKENGNIGRQGLLVNSMMSGKRGYRHELFGDTYLEFAKNKKLKKNEELIVYIMRLFRSGN